MQHLSKPIPLAELLNEDLSQICDDLRQEFGAMSGGRLLITRHTKNWQRRTGNGRVRDAK